MSDKKDIKSLKCWCSAKTSDNHARAKWGGECVGCCLFCDEEDCSLRTCKRHSRDHLCTWKRTPAEWLLGRIDRKAGMETYQRRRVEYYLEQGHKVGEDSWTGSFLTRMKKRFGEDFGEPQAALE